MTQLKTVSLKSGHDRRLKNGHLWVFSNELQELDTTIPPGTAVEVKSYRGESFGTGFYNPNSLITVRLLQTDVQVIDRAFFLERLTTAKQYRERILPGKTAYRLCFGESDFLPGLVIDRYGDYFSIQILSAGIELYLDEIISVLKELFPGLKGIAEKNSSHLRNLEGLPLRDGVVFGEIPPSIQIRENDINYEISILDGQKTGYFLDQKLNRRIIGELSSGLTVLDCFTNQGGFALNAAKGGAKKVTGIDISAAAVESCRANAKLNGYAQTEFVIMDVFRFLQESVGEKKQFDLVILDPPSFTKSKKNVPAARKGYAEINRLGMKLVPQGGFLATASCSQHIFEDTFLDIIREEANKLGRQLRLVYRGGQAPDHPVLDSMPETRYLKFFLFQVV
ncbi:MAG: class I SAM-dependent rRNA methyltransferase [Bacteroidetes bacterium]|nr:class I SAM-dependent rRNA methyltransferase [Bacteroidota bacterium]